MTPRFPFLTLASVVFSTFCFVETAQADLISVTSGKAVVAWDDPSYFTFSGAGGFMLAGLFPHVSSSPQQICFAGCAPGTSVNFSAVFGGPEFGSLGIATAATIDGITYSAAPPTVDLTGILVFDAPTIVLPPISAMPGTTLIAPFTFHGQVAGFERGELDAPRFEVNLSGHGTVELHFSTAGMQYTQPEVTYSFAAAEPVPEPASFTLFATALAMLQIATHRARFARPKPRNGLAPTSSSPLQTGDELQSCQ
jgi:hypothetical protein